MRAQGLSLLPPPRGLRRVLLEEDMWVVWQKNSISFYGITGYWLYLARVKASICFDGVYLNVPGEYH